MLVEYKDGYIQENVSSQGRAWNFFWRGHQISTLFKRGFLSKKLHLKRIQEQKYIVLGGPRA